MRPCVLQARKLGAGPNADHAAAVITDLGLGDGEDEEPTDDLYEAEDQLDKVSVPLRCCSY